jgi:DNA-binding transcriptional MerR regulator
VERKWFKIGEAAELLGVSPKELRYWESVIPEIKPRRSKGNLRYYHVDELPRLRTIRAWLREGLTVADCRDLLARGVVGTGDTVPVIVPPTQPLLDGVKPDLSEILLALQLLLEKLKSRPPPPSPLRPPKTRQPKPLPPPPGTPPLLLDE